MKSISKIMAVMMLFVSLIYTAQIKNTKTETVKIYGNNSCEAAIEKAGNVKNVAMVNWDKNSKMATLTYDLKKTNGQEILKRIAIAGYDSESFYAPDHAYASLPSGCHYERNKKIEEAGIDSRHDHSSMENMLTKKHDHSFINKENKKDESPLKNIQENYFVVKDALVKSDAKTASAASRGLMNLISGLKMSDLSPSEHEAWMKVVNDLGADAKLISQTQDIKKQREAFKSLSKSMYELLKTSNQSTIIYYQYCPMQDANWLSTESTIKNPYYGAQMLTCGNTVETLK